VAKKSICFFTQSFHYTKIHYLICSFAKTKLMNVKSSLTLLIVFCFSNNLYAQKITTASKSAAKPKIVVGLVIDQMRWDYLYRYSNRYTDGGFNRLLKKGYSFENTLISYTPTYTAPGHACIYTGSIPAIHGIIGNNWYDKINQKKMYCTQDTTAKGLGNDDEEGRMSPRNLWTTTITDELRLSNNFRSKVIGIALKDRGAILPAGHSANAAYWYDDNTGKWITSSYYMEKLPSWVNNFNARDEAASMMSKDWNTLYPINTYSLSTADDKIYENNLQYTKSHTFPYSLSSITKGKYSTFKYTPYASTFTFNFAKQAIENEKLGTGNVTDFLAVSISSTDYMGHTFGPNSVEAEDTYLRLDKDIADFLNYLDAKMGRDNYLIFLSADHGVAHIPNFLKENKIPADVFTESINMKELNKLIEDSFGIKKCILSIENYQVYIDIALLNINRKDVAVIKMFILDWLRAKPFVTHAFELSSLPVTTIAEPIKTMLTNGYLPARSGDIQILIKPGYFDGGNSNKGTAHGLWNPYDAHIPLLFYGWAIKHGKTSRETYMTDIAPTIAALLQIQMPSGCVGKVLGEVMK
jgi:predicted AlkP superfamily pyrophosphatase or phosphodiesterase